MFENSIWTGSERWRPVSASKDFCFVLPEIGFPNHIYYKPSTSATNHPRYDCQHVWILFQRSSAVLDRFFRFPQENLEWNWSIYNTCFLKNTFFVSIAKTGKAVYTARNTDAQSNNSRMNDRIAIFTEK